MQETPKAMKTNLKKSFGVIFWRLGADLGINFSKSAAPSVAPPMTSALTNNAYFEKNAFTASLSSIKKLSMKNAKAIESMANAKSTHPQRLYVRFSALFSSSGSSLSSIIGLSSSFIMIPFANYAFL